MPNERISMSKLKQLIGLQTSNLSVRELARALGLSIGAVSKYLRAVRAASIEAAGAESLSEAELELPVFGPAQPGALAAPDCAWIHNELKRTRHVTLRLLWEEYAQAYCDAAYRRSAFLRDVPRREKRLKRSMRQRLRVCGSHAHPAAPGLARQPRASAGVLRRSAHDLRARQPASRSHARRSLRAAVAAT